MISQRLPLTFCLLLGATAHGLAALPGSLDPTFDPGSGANDVVKQVIVLENGKILIAGYFTAVNGVPRGGIARLESSGAVDSSFDPGSGADNGLSAMAVQPDGKIVIGGEFTQFDGIPRGRVARLADNGKLDLSFDPGSGATGTTTPVVLCLALQNDGKVLIGGSFTNVNGVLRPYLARLQSNGSLDADFDAGIQIEPGKGLFSMRVLRNGQIMAGGVFTRVGGVLRSALARLNANGGLDPTFNANFDTFSVVFAVGLRSDDTVVAGGFFYNDTLDELASVAAFDTAGNADPSFRREVSPNDQVNSVVLQPDGKVLLGGYFTRIQETSRNGIARLNSNGTLDTSFDPGLGATGGTKPGLLTLAVQPDGKVMVAGSFSRINRTDRNNVARLLGDPSSPPPTITSHPVSQTVCAGQPASFTVSAEGTGALTYQWSRNGGPIPGATAASYSITAVAPEDAGSYDVTVTSASGTASSTAATLTVSAALVFTTQPASQLICPGFGVTLAVAVSGVGPFSYQWRKEGVPINGATSTTLTLNPASAADAGVYDVVVQGGCGPVTSGQAALTLCPPGPFSLQAVGLQAGGGFALELSGDVGRRYAIQSSTDLANWAAWMSIVLESPVVTLTDQSVGEHPVKFYRVLPE